MQSEVSLYFKIDPLQFAIKITIFFNGRSITY